MIRFLYRVLVDFALEKRRVNTLTIVAYFGKCNGAFSFYIFPLSTSKTLDLNYLVDVNKWEGRVAGNKRHPQIQQEHKLEMLGRLAAGITHEINTPIQYISDNASFLQDGFDYLLDLVESSLTAIEEAKNGELSEERLLNLEKKLVKRYDYYKAQIPHAFEQSFEGLKRVIHIVSAMRDFSHTTHGERSWIDLHQVIDTTVSVSRNEWKYHARIINDFTEHLPLIYAMRDELGQVFLNLIVNSAHAIASEQGDSPDPDLGKIKITTAATSDYVLCTFEDNGPGIPADIVDKVFNPFFTTKESGVGTGQGLALVKNVIEDKHAGNVVLKEHAGKGARFIIRIPIGEEDE